MTLTLTLSPSPSPIPNFALNPNPNPSPNPGHGVFARCALRANQAVAEYGGPRLPLDMLQHGEYALEVTGTDTFIDGNWDLTLIPSPHPGPNPRES